MKKKDSKTKDRNKAVDVQPSSTVLLLDLKELIERTRGRVAHQINAELVILNWNIGNRIKTEILNQERAEYGQQIVKSIADELTSLYGRGFSRANLFHMVRFAETFPNKEIVYSLSRQLGWTHFRQIIYLKDELRREFYSEMCCLERWSVRTLQKKIGGMLFERTALSKKTDALVKQELAALREEHRLTPDLIFRDPYLLDFLGLKDAFSEKDLEEAILREMELFLLELGSDFSFIARQKRITVDNEDFYIDLLFFHRELRRLVVIELKLDKFSPSDKGQVELYLRWLDKYERKVGEESPVGLILCAGKSTEQIELLSLDRSDIRVAEYITDEIPKSLLADKLNDAIKHARERLASQRLLENQDE